MGSQDGRKWLGSPPHLEGLKKTHFGGEFSPYLGDLRSQWLLTTYESWVQVMSTIRVSLRIQTTPAKIVGLMVGHESHPKNVSPDYWGNIWFLRTYRSILRDAYFHLHATNVGK